MDLSACSVDRANSLTTFLVSANALTSEIFFADYNLCILMAEFILGENIDQVESTATSQAHARVEMISSETEEKTKHKELGGIYLTRF